MVVLILGYALKDSPWIGLDDLPTLGGGRFVPPAPPIPTALYTSRDSEGFTRLFFAASPAKIAQG